jgi:hypothetical protein
MKKKDILKKIQSSIIAAKSHIDALEQLTAQLAEKEGLDLNISSVPGIQIIAQEDDQIAKVIEGIFSGEKMIANNNEEYPVPANYASKSKLVQGDQLKLTIRPNGSFVYKQIIQIPRKVVQGKLILDGSQYKVLCQDRTYNVLYASISFFRGSVGDSATILIPTDQEATWGAIDNIIQTKKPAFA